MALDSQGIIKRDNKTLSDAAILEALLASPQWKPIGEILAKKWKAAQDALAEIPLLGNEADVGKAVYEQVRIQVYREFFKDIDKKRSAAANIKKNRAEAVKRGKQ